MSELSDDPVNEFLNAKKQGKSVYSLQEPLLSAIFHRSFKKPFHAQTQRLFMADLGKVFEQAYLREIRTTHHLFWNYQLLAHLAHAPHQNIYQKLGIVQAWQVDLSQNDGFMQALVAFIRAWQASLFDRYNYPEPFNTEAPERVNPWLLACRLKFLGDLNGFLNQIPNPDEHYDWYRLLLTEMSIAISLLHFPHAPIFQFAQTHAHNFIAQANAECRRVMFNVMREQDNLPWLSSQWREQVYQDLLSGWQGF